MSLIQDIPFDINRPPKEVLIDKYNQINGTQFNPDEFILGPVIVVTNPQYNTEVTLTPASNSIWMYGFKIFYTRVHIANVLTYTAKVNTQGFTSLYPLLPVINQVYGINLSEQDVEDAPIVYSDPAEPTSDATVEIIVNPSSYFFLGQTTLELNRDPEYGLSVFESETTHYLAVSGLAGSSLETEILAFDSLGVKSPFFNYGANVAIDSSMIVDLWISPIGEITVIGDFVFSENVNGVRTPRAAKMLRLSNRGDVILHTNGNVFAVDETGVKRIPDWANGVVWLIDDGSMTARANRLYCYSMETGALINITAQVPNHVTAVRPHNEHLFVATLEGNNAFIYKLVAATGQRDTSFTPKPIVIDTGRPEDKARIADIRVNGTSVHFSYEIFTTGSVPSYNGSFDEILSLGGALCPFGVITEDGTVVPSVVGKLVGHVPGAFGASGREFYPTDTHTVFASNIIQYTGTVGASVLGVTQAGAITRSTPPALAYERLPAMYSAKIWLTPGSAGTLYHAFNYVNEPTSNLSSGGAAAVEMYNHEGFFCGNLIKLDSGTLVAYGAHVFE